MKKIICLALTVALIIGSISSVSAAKWSTYFGLNKGWYEGTKGSLTSNSATGWTAKIQSIGWGGCWGGQVYQKAKIIKGKTYTIKFNIKSSKLDKWVYLKLGDAKGKKINLAKWLDCKKGKTVSVNETFTAKYDGDSIYFGVGGDFGDRAAVKTDEDAKVRYKYASSKKLDGRLPSDYSADHPTVITVSGFSFSGKGGSGKVTTKKGLSRKFISMNKGDVKTIKFKGAKGKVKWKTTNKKAVKLYKAGKNKIIVFAKKRGTAKVIAKYKKKKYTCKVAIF